MSLQQLTGDDKLNSDPMITFVLVFEDLFNLLRKTSLINHLINFVS